MAWKAVQSQTRDFDSRIKTPCSTFNFGVDQEVRKYVCEICSNIYKKSIYLKRHKKKYHSLTQEELEKRFEEEQAEERRKGKTSEYRCDHCDSIYLCSYTYRQHARIHRWLEDIEQRDFSHLTSDRSCQTAKRVFNTPQAYLCKICSRALDTEPLLHAHVEVCQKHQPHFSHLNSNCCCYVCGKEFDKYLNLRKRKTILYPNQMN